MYITVRLLNGFQQPLTYKIPTSWRQEPKVADIVTVPLQKRTELAFITDVSTQAPQENFVIKDALEQQALPHDPVYTPFIKQLAAYYCVNEFTFYKRFAHYLDEQHEQEIVPPITHIAQQQIVTLTQEQQQVAQEIDTAFDTHTFQPLVLHGVTGSGKTEMYKHAAQRCLREGKTFLLLLPEVSLAVRFTQIFKAHFTDVAIFGFHSATGKAEKRQLWQHLYAQKAAIIIGVHLPLLLPLPKLGCIVIDEEHEGGYQEKKFPRIHTKEAALMRAQLSKIPIILGSATPSISSLYNVEHKGWKLLRLQHRFKGSFPEVRVVQLDKKNKKREFWISKELEDALCERIAKKEQAIIFLNRRGYSFFVQCFACDYIFSCTACSVSLTFHEPNMLQCHYCGIKKTLPSACPTCNQPEKQFLKKGIGTQQVVKVLQKMLPEAIIARADLDSTVNKKKWQQTINDMHEKRIDILVGTQTITKGYHFPGVTLVGVLWADSNIHFPFYAACESTLSQLIQVSGRAGRESDNGLVILQTIALHPIFSFINEKNYKLFYDYELAHRQELRYPPFVRFAEIEFRHENEQQAINDALTCADYLYTLINSGLDLTILGPATPMVAKVQHVFMQKIYIKSSSIKNIITAYRQIMRLPLTSKHFFTPNPTN